MRHCRLDTSVVGTCTGGLVLQRDSRKAAARWWCLMLGGRPDGREDRGVTRAGGRSVALVWAGGRPGCSVSCSVAEFSLPSFRELLCRYL